MLSNVFVLERFADAETVIRRLDVFLELSKKILFAYSVTEIQESEHF
jgi:hypothetical protein